MARIEDCLDRRSSLQGNLEAEGRQHGPPQIHAARRQGRGFQSVISGAFIRILDILLLLFHIPLIPRQVFIILIHSFRLFGTHIIGPRTEEMILEAVLAVEFGVNPEGIAGTAHSHPTFAETFMEAAAAVRRLGRWVDPAAAVASAGRNVGGQGKNLRIIHRAIQ